MKKKSKKGLWIIVAIIVVIAVVAVIAILGNHKQVTVNSAEAQSRNIEITVMATGYVQPVDKVDVGTQVSGVIEKIYVDFNSEVKTGDLLAELDRSTLTEKVTQGNASINSAKSDLNYAQQNFDRVEGLYEAKAATKVAYEEALNKLTQAQTSYVNAQANLHQAQVNLGYASIYSPIDGVILDRTVNTGQTVAASFNTPTLFTIAKDLTKMQVEADVDEADIGRIEMGQKVTFTVDAYNADVFEGTVNQIRLQPTVTSNVVTYTVIIEAPNPDQKLFPGMTANINIVTNSESGLTIPMEALYFEPSAQMMDILAISAENRATQPPARRQGAQSEQSQGGQRGDQGQNMAQSEAQSQDDVKNIWVRQNGDIMRRQITVGINDGINVIVKSGLHEGEEVVLSANIEKKQRGQAVNIMPNPGRRR